MLASKGGELKTITVLITAGVNVNHVAEVSLPVCILSLHFKASL